MNNGSVQAVAVAPLSREQRQRLECMTAVRDLWTKTGAYGAVERPEVHVILELTDYLVTGAMS